MELFMFLEHTFILLFFGIFFSHLIFKELTELNEELIELEIRTVKLEIELEQVKFYLEKASDIEECYVSNVEKE